MKVSTTFAGNTLKAEDIGDRQVTVTIADCREQELGEEKERKAVLYFEGKAKGLALNLTNFQTLFGLFGTDESDDWKGKRIVLYTEPTKFGNKTVPGIRIRGVSTAAPAPRPTPPPPPPSPDEWQASDEDVPF
jgi:hypothetical protein